MSHFRAVPILVALCWLTLAGYSAQTYTAGVHHSHHVMQKFEHAGSRAAVLEEAGCPICDALQAPMAALTPFVGGQLDRLVSGTVAARVSSGPEATPDLLIQPRAPPFAVA